MYKSLCVAALLTSPFMAAGQDKTPTVVSPAIVAKRKLLNQTKKIPTTTLYTPKQTGLFRLSIYGIILSNDQNEGGTWYVNVGWTDDFGPEAVNGLTGGTVYHLGQFRQLFGGNVAPPGYAMGGPALTLERDSGPADHI